MSTYSIFPIKRETRSACSNTQQKRQSLYLSYASKFIEFRDIIETAKKMFSREQIWPDQCEYVIYKIQPMQRMAASIASLCNSTKQQDNHPLGSNRYSLMVSAHYLHDQTDRLTVDIEEYKEITNRPSARKSKQKLIISSLRSLDSSLHDLIKELDKAARSSQRLV